VVLIVGQLARLWGPDLATPGRSA